MTLEEISPELFLYELYDANGIFGISARCWSAARNAESARRLRERLDRECLSELEVK